MDIEWRNPRCLAVDWGNKYERAYLREIAGGSDGKLFRLELDSEGNLVFIKEEQ